MADLFFTAAIKAYAVSTSGAKTALALVAPPNHRVRVNAVEFFYDGVTGSNTPVVVDLIMFREGWSGAYTALTPQKNDPNLLENIQSLARGTYTTEPNGIVVLKTWQITPTSGFGIVKPYALENKVPGGWGLGLRMLAGAAVNVDANLDCEE